VDKFPNEPLAVDAQYQIGYIWFTASQLGTNDAAAANNAKTAFQDFLFHYPKSEKAAQARKISTFLSTSRQTIRLRSRNFTISKNIIALRSYTTTK
jgi:outer membrane protein assembly factor BamD (BamD/ComL family)